jgi:hypothetical protein
VRMLMRCLATEGWHGVAPCELRGRNYACSGIFNRIVRDGPVDATASDIGASRPNRQQRVRIVSGEDPVGFCQDDRERRCRYNGEHHPSVADLCLVLSLIRDKHWMRQLLPTNKISARNCCGPGETKEFGRGWLLP